MLLGNENRLKNQGKFYIVHQKKNGSLEMQFYQNYRVGRLLDQVTEDVTKEFSSVKLLLWIAIVNTSIN